LLKLILPRVKSDAITKKYGRFIISPLERGYGITVGNALRRVLLSSLPGAAVTSIRVSDVYHEFSTIPHVKEDMPQLILNIKQLRIKMSSEDSAHLRLSVKGEGIVTAGDLECPSYVEIVNPDLHLLTVDSDEADLEIELVVGMGRGYSPAEERGKLPIGELPVDAIFTPIRKVSYNVEPTRVGQMANFDKLVMEIWTDGTINPEDALNEAAKILVQHFALVGGLEELPEEEEVEEGIPPQIYEMPIEDLELSARLYNALKRAGISNVGEVLDRLERGDKEILVIRNIGEKSLAELKERLKAMGCL
jgi:DNA-directed RNA polymerase subunit alpha